MKTHANYRAGLLTAASFLLLASCGGGGNGNGGTTAAGAGTASADGTWLTLSPSPVNLSGSAGMTVYFDVEARATRTFSQSPNILVIDPKNILAPGATVNSPSSQVYDIALKTASNLAAGTYSTNAEVRVCEDDPATCARPFPGSPWHLPVTLTVSPPANTQVVRGVTIHVDRTDLTAYEGDETSMYITFSPSPDSKPAHILVSATNDFAAFSPDVPVNPGEYNTATVILRGIPKAGVYHTNLYFIGTNDDGSRSVATNADGTPMGIPVQINVLQRK